MTPKHNLKTKNMKDHCPTNLELIKSSYWKQAVGPLHTRYERYEQLRCKICGCKVNRGSIREILNGNEHQLPPWALEIRETGVVYAAYGRRDQRDLIKRFFDFLGFRLIGTNHYYIQAEKQR